VQDFLHQQLLEIDSSERKQRTPPKKSCTSPEKFNQLEDINIFLFRECLEVHFRFQNGRFAGSK